MEPYFDLGTYTRGTSTASMSAQTWFDRGLVWSYAFHHEEAIRCFEHAVEHDPGFALAHWGIAYAIGPNYNKQWDVVRVPPGTWRGYEAGPEGLELLVVGAPNLGEDPRDDVDGRRGWWAD